MILFSLTNLLILTSSKTSLCQKQLFKKIVLKTISRLKNSLKI